MAKSRPGSKPTSICELRLVNGSVGDPGLFVDYPGRNDALLFDAGENSALDAGRLSDLEAVFISHHHIDHFVGFDRVLRANLDRDKTLHVYGPPETIDRVYQRITSYEFPYFPFMKLVLHVVEIHHDHTRSAELSCPKRFPPPEPIEAPWTGPTIHENDVLRVEAAHLDHTVPCLGFALIEKTGYHPDRSKLRDGPLRPGPWVGEVLAHLRNESPDDTMISIEGGQFPLRGLADRYFLKRPQSRLTYIVDTAWSSTSEPALLSLARRSRILFCDSFYAQAQATQAEKHRHLTATRAGELAAHAKVDRLILIHFSQRYHGQEAKLVAEARAAFPNVDAAWVQGTDEFD